MTDLAGLTLGIFLLIGLGVLARRLGLLSYDDRVPLNNIIIFISLPALIFVAARRAPFDESLAVISAVSLFISLATVAIAYLAAGAMKLRGPVFGAFMLAGGVGNTGYLGYPLTQALFGRQHLVKAVFYDIFGTVLVLFTAGIYFAAKYGSGPDGAARQGFTLAAPNLAGLILGFATHGLTLPVPINTAVNALAQSTTGIIMLSIGVSLSGTVGKSRLPVLAITGLKLALMPVLALSATVLLDLEPVVGGVILLQASAPVALMTFVIGDKYNLDREFLSGAILASTLLSMITIPGWQFVASNLLLS